MKIEALIRRPFERIATKLRENYEEQTRQDIRKIFYDIDPEDLEEFMDKAEYPPKIMLDTDLTRKELLIKAVIEGLGKGVIGKYQNHQNETVRGVADILAWGQFGEIIAEEMNRTAQQSSTKA